MITVSTRSPGRTDWPSASRKCTSRPSRARPDIRPVPASLRPSPVGDQHLDGAAHQPAVGLPGDLVLQFNEAAVAVAHGLGIDLIRQLSRGSAGPLGVLEGERARETGRSHHVERGGEVGLGLAGEADDDVGGDGGVGDRGAYPIDDPQVALGPVAATHPAKHVVGTGLQRHVQGRTDVGRLGHRRDDVVGEVARVRAR